jgi:hypothetical protein
MEKHCLECSDKLRGRTDKKFCTDMCRNAYNNRLNSNINNYVRNVNNVLKRNRRILEALTVLNESKIHKGKLIEMGFDFKYFTHKKSVRAGVIYFCYDLGYLATEKDDYVSIKLSMLELEAELVSIAAEPNPKYKSRSVSGDFKELR